MLATALVLTAGLATVPVAQAAVSLSSGTAAIQQLAAKVKRMTQASSYRLSKCSARGSGVTCQIRWEYKAKDTYYDPNTDTWKTRRRVVLACGLKALAYSASGGVKVKRASQIRCKSFD